MTTRLEWGVTIGLLACALTTTVLVVHRFAATSPSSRTGADKSASIAEWRSYLDKGPRIGPATAQVQVLEFADFECPYCGNFHEALKIVERKYPNQIGLTYVHYPIPGHRFAIPAARAAECANDQNRFEAMYHQLFEGQDQLGLKPWNDYATAAGVLDIPAFDACIKKTDPIPRVEEGKGLGAKLDVQGTPTVIINGWKLGHPPTERELDQMVQRILAGKPPLDQKS